MSTQNTSAMTQKEMIEEIARLQAERNRHRVELTEAVANALKAQRKYCPKCGCELNPLSDITEVKK